jgi:hypothetical protein
MNDPMVLRNLNYEVRILKNGLKIVKGQANVIEVENQSLKREVDRLKTELAEVTQ